MRAYSRTLTMGVLMAAVIVSTIIWGIGKLDACLVAATVVITEYGADQWRDRYRKAVKDRSRGGHLWPVCKHGSSSSKSASSPSPTSSACSAAPAHTHRTPAMENAGDTSAAAAAMHAAMNTPATTSQDAHAAPAAEASQAQENIPYGVADPERWPEPADPASPGGGIKP